MRIPRNPNIGDKFCSRHGQKGVCSMHWPVIDMPFTEDGIVPDIIINPHAFPSRMTIGMLIESMAGKSGCLHGKTQNGTAFQFNAQSSKNKDSEYKAIQSNQTKDSEHNTMQSSQTKDSEYSAIQCNQTKDSEHNTMQSSQTKDSEHNTNQNSQINNNEHNTIDFENVQGVSAIDYFGKELEQAGYNYYGNEVMYSGVTGDVFTAEIFIGVVYYQRLRHMVNDKFQVRTTGAVQTLTKQPVGGRKNKGGVRLGEMERDALIAHGVSSIIQDRLQYASDYTNFMYCVKCKNILFVVNGKCFCGGHEYKTVGLPYAFKYLCSELMSMNVKVSLDIEK